MKWFNLLCGNAEGIEDSHDHFVRRELCSLVVALIDHGNDRYQQIVRRHALDGEGKAVVVAVKVVNAGVAVIGDGVDMRTSTFIKVAISV